MKKQVIFISMMLFAFSIYANPYLYLAGNISAFETSDATVKPGFSIALGKQWNIYKGFGLGSELRFSRRQSLLKNKTVKPGQFDPEESYVAIHNFNISKGSLDIPIYLCYQLPIFKVKPNLKIGYSISIDKYVESGSKITKVINFSELSDEKKRNFKFDYESIGELDFTGSGHYSYEIVFSVPYKKILYNFQYINSYIKRIQGIYIREHLSTYSLGIGILFNNNY